MKRFGVIGDLHLGKLNHRLEDYMALQFKTLDNIIKRIRENGLTEVVLLGDVFDSPFVNPAIIIRLIRFFRTYSDIKWTWVEGNHDRTAQIESSIDVMNELSELEALPNLRIITKPTKDGIIGFLPYPHKKPLKGTQMSIAHVDRPGARRDNGSLTKAAGEWDEDHHFVIGHIHTAQKIGKTYYTGSPYQLSFGEGTEKHWATVTIDGNKKGATFDYKRIPIVNEYELVNLHITTKKQLKKLSLKPHPTYYKIVFDGVDVPDNFLVDHPNCFIENMAIARTSIEDALASIEKSGEIIVINPTYKLPEWLTDEGFSEDEVAWVVAEVESVMAA